MVFNSGVGMPPGLIVMWSGLVVDIPAGWLLCDGTGGTPDLRARFIQGAAIGVDPGATGGSTAKTTAGHKHSDEVEQIGEGGAYNISTATIGGLAITDIRPLFYDLAFLISV